MLGPNPAAAVISMRICIEHRTGWIMSGACRRLIGLQDCIYNEFHGVYLKEFILLSIDEV